MENKRLGGDSLSHFAHCKKGTPVDAVHSGISAGYPEGQIPDEVDRNQTGSSPGTQGVGMGSQVNNEV